jgi:hypothetical protein
MKFNILQDFNMKKLLSNFDWSFETSKYKISPRNNNGFLLYKTPWAISIYKYIDATTQ